MMRTRVYATSIREIRDAHIVRTIEVLGFALLLLYEPTTAAAQANRTWVSGTGNDMNPCTRMSPCLTWQGAYAQTAAGGEIDALDPGGFGVLTIKQAITIDGGGGQVASTMASGSSGITVAAGANDAVVIRNVNGTIARQ